VSGKGAELAYRLGVAVGSDRHEVAALAAIDADGIELDAFQQWRPCP
jgi:hypothetical protein